MNESLYSYIKLGVTHHLLNFRSFEDCNYHLKTLPFLLNHPAFQVVDLFIANDDQVREKEVALVKNSDKEVIYNGGGILLDAKYHICLRMKKEREKVLHILRKEADLAIKVNALKFVTPSILDPGPEKRERAKENFSKFLCDFSQYVSDNSNIKVVLEPSDRDVDKGALLGPLEDAVEVIERARNKGAQNLGLIIDMGHLPLLKESFGYAIKTCGNLLWHVHIGNCIIKDRKHPWYGDKHPPIGFPRSEHGIKELSDFLQLLLKYGYLKKTQKRSISLEIRTFPDRSAQETLSQQLRLLEKVWRKVNI